MWKAERKKPIVTNRYYCKKKHFAVYNVFKDDIRQLADLKQQISQKMILMSLCCEVISSFVIFAVLDNVI